MKSKKLSVIVPIYNTPQELLKECIESLQKISSDQIEFLLVNDGSKNFIEEFILGQNLDERFKYIYQENSGVSGARNNGLSKAEGEWITFVDPDDIIKFDFEKVNFIEFNDKDIIFFGYNSISIDNSIIHSNAINSLIDVQKLESKDISSILFNCLLRLADIESKFNGFYLGVPWGKLIRKSFIEKNNLRFDLILRKRQDALFSAQAYMSTDRYGYLEDDLATYSYRVDNPSSVTRNYNPKIKKIYIHLLSQINELAQKSANYDSFKESLVYYAYDLLTELEYLDFCNPLNDMSYEGRKADYLNYLNTESISHLYGKIEHQMKVTRLNKILYFLNERRYFRLVNFIYKIGNIIKRRRWK